MIGIKAGKGLILFIFFTDELSQAVAFEDGTKCDLGTAMDELVLVGLLKGKNEQ